MKPKTRSDKPKAPNRVGSMRLLGCPFCGSQPESKEVKYTGFPIFQWEVKCQLCGCATAHSYKSRDDAETKWQMRPIENAVRAAEPLLKHYERQLAASLSCDSRSHDQDREPRRLLNAILDALRQPNA
jgi:hypothetical protein